MCIAPDASSIALANALARAAANGTGQQALRQFASLAAQAAMPSGPSPSPPQGPARPSNRIGIWRPIEADGGAVWERTGDPEAWRFWADVPRFTVSPDRRRVALLGESVARGYFYDPIYSPAIALSQMIASDAATRDVDVVDLARVDCSRRMLLDLIVASRVLEPACWIVFAGNNWTPYAEVDAVQLDRLHRLIGGGSGWDQVRAYVETICREQTAAFVERLAALSADTGVPVLMVIPEFNLAGWRHECGASTPFASGAEARQWAGLRRTAEAALAAGYWDRAAAIAERMRAIDGGGTPRTLEILAACCRERGARNAARQWLECAKDAELTVPVRRSPRCFTVIQQTLRESAARAGIAVVDLPALFQELQCGDPPDGRFFHDYCHLTLDGIRAAMAATAEQLLPLLDAPARSWRELYRVDPGVPRSTIAEASLMAAVHNAAWGQPFDTIQRQCREAVTQWPEIRRTMTQVIDFHVRRAPSVLCRSFDALTRTATLSAVNLLSLSSDPTAEKLLSPSLVRAVASVLADSGQEAAREIDALLAREHDIAAGAADLLATPYHCASCADPAFRWRQRGGFYKAYAAEEIFRFVTSHAQPLTLRITWRVPHVTPDDELRVLVNDVPVTTLRAASKWRAAAITIDRALLRAGWNEVRLEWPTGTWSTAEHLQSLATSIERGLAPEIFPVWGELQALTVSSATQTVARPVTATANTSVSHGS